MKPSKSLKNEVGQSLEAWDWDSGSGYADVLVLFFGGKPGKVGADIWIRVGGDVSYVQGRQLSFGFLIGKGKMV